MRILLLESIHDEAVELLARIGETHRIESLDPAHVIEQFRLADAVLTRGRGRMAREALLAGARLRCVARCGAGTDNIDVATASERGLPVLFSPDGTTFSVAEHAIMLMLAVGRRLVFLDRAVRANRWEIRNQVGIGAELYGKTLAILGLGRIGARIAELGAAFGMRPIYWSPNRRDPRYEFVEIDELFRRADVLAVCLSLQPETRGIVSAARLDLMKPSAMLINIARGEMIDEDALARALAEGRLAGAGLDVLAEEPPRDDHPFFQLDNVVLTPHLATITDVAYRKMCVEVAEQVARVLQGEPPDRRYVRNPEVLKS